MRRTPEHLNLPKLAPIHLYRESVMKFACTLVTPLYGGGVETGKIDAAMPIRATSIRGQLRFWWRITNRKRFTGPDKHREMFEAEREIWGGLGNAETLRSSKVDIRVTDLQILQSPAPAARYDKKPQGGYKTFPAWEKWAGGPVGGYILFPAQGKANAAGIQIEPGKLLKPNSVTWTLEIQFRDDCSAETREQVLTALRWWASFGGLGARTRRGLGAVKVDDLRPVNPDEAKEQGCTLVLQTSPQENAIEAWQKAIKVLRDFRQEKGIGRNPGAERNRPGRSRWPEADAIRRLSGKNASQHPPIHPAGNLFPRAQFGLPIIFKFKDEKQSDPQQHTLQPQNAERMASPIVLRPYWDGNKWFPAAIYLGKIATSLLLKGPTNETEVCDWPSDSKERKISISKIRPLLMVEKKHPGKISTPLSAFLNYFKNPSDYKEE
ncbi:type III-B CRISPR module RAMP protein Cmr1 [Acidithiobacillus caldus]|jgi:CRISPR-associated protein Cmr1|uniref:Type III-B CRISPR module RAMP protein Cmr1 n=1 Tax=Acidithiobacillus caldus TaxID=33059 RepID=A0A1E7YKL9_9PROT|nr:type III-B CRISPR module RAMP protein Cmr1 [Acidithiobacillus caldus]OFC30537.1 type III-B CRISPR module RAMP protein Cmr1 [Acidithiobacillus caldus]OFC36802.1 type III-B CRISPR module RAMP protein Cmr1 [Acidithiobacillus caldus]OFC41755.1 type III-B CRISPR module RAMP protein Cmr1 [Acidithiobacillus caldus]